MDSLHPIEWYVTDPDMIELRIVPIYYVLTGQWDSFRELMDR